MHLSCRDEFPFSHQTYQNLMIVGPAVTPLIGYYPFAYCVTDSVILPFHAGRAKSWSQDGGTAEVSREEGSSEGPA